MSETLSSLHQRKNAHVQMKKQAFVCSLPWLFAALLLTVGSIYAGDALFLSMADDYPVAAVALAASVISWLLTLRYWKKLADLRHCWTEYRSADRSLALLDRLTSTEALKSQIADLQQKATSNQLVDALLEFRRPDIDKRVVALRQQELQDELNKEVIQFQKNADRQLDGIKQDLPLFKARASVQASISFLQSRREELQAQWEAAYEQFSWWNVLMYGGGPDFSELDRVLADLKSMNRRMEVRYKDDFEALERHFFDLKAKAIKRVVEAKGRADEYIREHAGTNGIESDLLKKALLFSAMSIPISAWSDLDQAGDVFHALRGVNGYFSDMSDTETWWETLFLPTESLAGVAALTKGAYFEQLVAADSGGALFEHFNHPGTDIVIDGTAFQIKATDSEGYINSVADGIPVIATSEVAGNTGAIDSGYTNEDLTNAVDLALGGTVIDFGDSAVDAVLAGVGGLGLLATLKGINHASVKYQNGGDGVEAFFEGAGVAIEGTARTIVNTAEMGYKVITSRPSRFMGRMLLKGLVKLDEKLMADIERKSG